MTTATPPAQTTIPDTHLPDIRLIDVESIELSIANHRLAKTNAKAIERLADSIAEHGLRQPVLVSGPDGGPYTLVYGHRRLAAFKLLGWPQIQAELAEPMDLKRLLSLRAVENFHREDLRVIERVMATEQVHAETDGDIEDTAHRLNLEINVVQDLIYLGQRLTDPVRDFALNADLPISHLREIAKVGDEMEQWKLVIDVAGGSPWGWTTKKPGEISKQYQGEVQKLFDDVEEGSIKRMSVRDLKGKVAEAQRSLKTTPWSFELPVIMGKRKLPPCQGCPDNSESDRTLFEIETDDKNPRGICLNPGCYEAKKAAAEKAKTDLVKKFSRRKEAPKPAEIDEKAPDWLKPTTGRGVVQRHFKARAEGNDTPRSASSSASSSSGRSLSPLQKAIKKFQDAVREWDREISGLIDDVIESRPVLMVAFSSFTDWGYESWDNGFVAEYCGEPSAPEPFSGDLDKHDTEVLAMWAAANEIDDSDLPKAISDAATAGYKYRENYWSESIAVTIAMTKLLGIEIEPMPQWDDFKPGASKPKAETKAPVKKKASKKKVVKKKKKKAVAK